MNKVLKLINTRRSLFLVALVASFLILNFYLVLPKLERENICWATMSVLDDDQLYENAMKSYIAKFIEYRDVTRPRKGLFRSDDWGGVTVWSGEKHNFTEIKQKLQLLVGKNHKEFEQAFSLQEIESENLHMLDFSIEDNGSMIVFLQRPVSLYPNDCCHIALRKEVSDFSKSGNEVHHRVLRAKLKTHRSNLKYIRLDEYWMENIYGRKYRSPDQMSVEYFQKVTNEAHVYTQFIPLSACGEVKTSFIVDY